MIEIPLPVFIYERCSGCGECVPVCPEGVLVMIGECPQLKPKVDCAYCGVCEEACPSDAIYLSYEIVLGGAA